MSEYVVGIDVSSSKICGAVGYLDSEKKMQLLGITTSDYDYDENRQSFKAEITSTINGVISRLEDIVNESLKEVYIAVPISMCEVVSTKGVVSFPTSKEINKEDVINVGEVAKFCVNKNEEIVQVDIEEYIVNGMKNIRNPIGIEASLLESEGNAFIVDNKYIKAYKQILNGAGLKIKGWIVNSIGMSKDILSDSETHKGVAIIDVGSTVSEVSVFKKGKFLDSFSIPLGGDIITHDISICLKLTLEESEKLKFKCKTLLKSRFTEKEAIKIETVEKVKSEIEYKVLEEIICERVREILQLILKRLYEEELGAHIESYVLVGGGVSQYRDIVSLATDIMGKPVRIGIPEYVGAANPIYSTAIGVIGYVLRKEQDLISENKLEDEDAKAGKSENKFMVKLKTLFKGFSNEEVAK